MKKKTLTALKGSIKKWEQIVNGTGDDKGPDNCPLCKEFHAGDCEGCPVAERTGEIWCIDTPYEKWALHCEDEHESTEGKIHPGCKTCLRLAKAELKFLKSLLP